INAVQEDQAGTLWIGSDGGLNVFKNGRLVLYPIVNSAGQDNADPVTAITATRTGDVWIGFGSRGLLRIKDGSRTAYGTKEGLSSDAVLSIHEDRVGVLWVGTYGGGVNRLEGRRFTA